MKNQSRKVTISQFVGSGFVSAALSLLASCGYVGSSAELAGFKNSGANSQKTVMGFDVIKQSVFDKRCVGCHSGDSAAKGVRLDSYDGAKANLAAIRRTAVEARTMPPRGGLSDAEASLLANWIDSGAPEKVTGPTPTPTPAPAPEPLPEPTFNAIKTVLFAKYACYQCHAAGERAANVPLETIADLKVPGNELVIDGDPDNSDLVKALEKSDRGRMPPKRMSVGLTEAEVGVVRTWIKNGAKD